MTHDTFSALMCDLDDFIGALRAAVKATDTFKDKWNSIYEQIPHCTPEQVDRLEAMAGEMESVLEQM